MDNLKKFYNHIVNLYIKIPVYLRGLLLFAILALIAMAFNKISKPDPVRDADKYIFISEDDLLGGETINSDLNENVSVDEKNNETTGVVMQNSKSRASLTTRRKKPKEIDNLTNFNDDFVIGKSSAPVAIVEFSSYRCPYCIKFHNDVMPSLKKDYIDTGKVKYIKRMIIQTDTLLGVLLPYCVSEDFRPSLIDDLYQNAGEWTKRQKQKSELKKIALRNGFTEATFNDCIKNADLANKLLKRQQDDIKELRVYSTPTVFINGNMERGTMDYEEFSKKINAELEKIDK